MLFRRVLDKNTGRYRELPEEDFQKLQALVQHNRTFSGIDIRERPELKFIDVRYDFSIHADNILPRS